MNKYSERSQSNLDSCDTRLQVIFTEALQVMDNSILCGYRTEADQLALYLEKKSKVRMGEHNRKPSLAVDAAPYPIDWEDDSRFILLAGIVLAIAHRRGIKIRWGGCWKMDMDLIGNEFKDLGHFEIVEDN